MDKRTRSPCSLSVSLVPRGPLVPVTVLGTSETAATRQPSEGYVVGRTSKQAIQREATVRSAVPCDLCVASAETCPGVPFDLEAGRSPSSRERRMCSIFFFSIFYDDDDDDVVVLLLLCWCDVVVLYV